MFFFVPNDTRDQIGVASLSLISLTFMAAYSPGNTTPPGQNNAVKHGDVSSE